MKVRKFYRPGAVLTSPEESLRDAAKKMRRAALSCLPVVHDGKVVAIVTERDIVDAAAKGALPTVARVADYMNDHSSGVALDDDSTAAQLKMLAIGCRHLPVIEGGQVVGMVAARDLYVMEARGETPPERVPAAVGAVAGTDEGGWPEEAPPDVDEER